jgi:hypothetical protein
MEDIVSYFHFSQLYRKFLFIVIAKRLNYNEGHPILSLSLRKDGGQALQGRAGKKKMNKNICCNIGRLGNAGYFGYTSIFSYLVHTKILDCRTGEKVRLSRSGS